ncbi:hypothetical protein RQP46_003933 [Phenoliferia psychrophenolica]
MSTSRRRGKDDDFIDADGGGDSSDSGADDPESDIDSDDAGPSTSSGRPKRARRPSGAKGGSKEKAPKSGTKTIGGKDKGKAWESSFQHTWDSVREDAQGSLESAVSDALLSGKNKRVLRDTTSIQRGIIRHVYLVIDLSLAMLVRDFKLPWLDLTLQYAREFVTEFFDQNPISQMAIMVTRDGSVERLSPLSGNPVDHLKSLANKKKLEPRGEPSLQNVLEMARSGLAHLPPHGSREVIIILGSLTTCDPGNIHATIDATEKDRIRVNIIGLSAEMRICKDICTRTKGMYHVVKEDELSLRELLLDFVSPPPTLAASKTNVLGAPASTGPTNTSDLMLMGFPALVQSPYPGLCSCHSKLKNTGSATMSK